MLKRVFFCFCFLHDNLNVQTIKKFAQNEIFYVYAKETRLSQCLFLQQNSLKCNIEVVFNLIYHLKYNFIIIFFYICIVQI